MRKIPFSEIKVGMFLKPIKNGFTGGIIERVDDKDLSIGFNGTRWAFYEEIGKYFDVIDTQLELPEETEVFFVNDDIKDALRYLIAAGQSDEMILKAHKSNPQQWLSIKTKALYNINYYVMMQKLIEIEDDGKLQADKGVYEDETHLMPVDYNSMIDIALATGDKEWFNELVAKTKEVVG